MKQTYLMLRYIAQQRGYSKQWIRRVYTRYYGYPPKHNWHDLEPIPPTYAFIDWVNTKSKGDE